MLDYAEQVGGNIMGDQITAEMLNTKEKEQEQLKSKVEETRAKAYTNEIRISRLEKHQKWMLEALIGTILIIIIMLKILLNITIGLE